MKTTDFKSTLGVTPKEGLVRPSWQISLWYDNDKYLKRRVFAAHYNTLISVTGSGHIKYKKRRLPHKIKDKTSCPSDLLRYMAGGHIFYK